MSRQQHQIMMMSKLSNSNDLYPVKAIAKSKQSSVGRGGGGGSFISNPRYSNDGGIN